jgi:hypothetical protein
MTKSYSFTADGDASSVRSSANSTSDPVKYDMSKSVLKELKSEIKTARDYESLKRITRANRDRLSNIPTTVLNSWLSDSDLVFVRMFGCITIRKKSKSLKPADYKQIMSKMITFLNILDKQIKFFNEEQKLYLNNASISEYQRVNTILDSINC